MVEGECWGKLYRMVDGRLVEDRCRPSKLQVTVDGIPKVTPCKKSK